MFINQKTRWLVLLLAAGSLVALRLPAAEAAATNAAAPPKPAPKGSELFPDTVVAKGKGVEVKRSQLDEALISIKAGASARGQMIPPEHMALLEQQVLERLIQVQLLASKATDDDKAKGKETCAKRLDEIKTRAGSEEALNRQLKSVGTTQEELRSKMAEECTAAAVLDRELKPNVTDADVKKFYDDNPSKFEEPEMVRASHILLSTRDMDSGKELSEDKKAEKLKLAKDLVKRARAGEDFAKLAKQYSEDPGSKDKGGEYTFPRGQMVREFETVAFSLKTNEVSDVVTTQFGYHVIKLSEKIPAKKVEFAKVSSDIKDYLKGQAMQKEIPDYMAKLRKDANVQILDEQLKPKENADTMGLPAGHPPLEPAKKSDAKIGTK